MSILTDSEDSMISANSPLGAKPITVSFCGIEDLVSLPALLRWALRVALWILLGGVAAERLLGDDARASGGNSFGVQTEI